MKPHAPDTGVAPINYRLKSEASIELLFQLFSTHYTPIRTKTWSLYQGSHYEKYTRFPSRTQRKPSHATTKSTLYTVSKDK